VWGILAGSGSLRPQPWPDMISTSSPRPDLVVIGGGIIGLSAARAAAGNGLRVRVLERDGFGGGATWAAAGMLSPLAEAGAGGPFLELGLRSLRVYGAWVEELEAASGIPVEFRRGGKLLVARPGGHEEGLPERGELARKHGISTKWLTDGALAREASGLAPEWSSALLIHDDYRVDSRALARALVKAATRDRIALSEGHTVSALLREGDRVVGVALVDGTRIEAGAVLLAAGAWSAQVGSLPRSLGVRPVRGQMLALLPEALPSQRVIEAGGIYLVPRDDGRLLVGATVEDTGFREGNTALGIRTLLDAATKLAPSLDGARVLEMWSGFRPGTSDGHPILGRYPDVEGLLIATGHYRNGILLAPITARIIGALAAGDAETDDSVSPVFRPISIGA